MNTKPPEDEIPDIWDALEDAIPVNTHFEDGALLSIAISMKRIADALEDMREMAKPPIISASAIV